MVEEVSLFLKNTLTFSEQEAYSLTYFFSFICLMGVFNKDIKDCLCVLPA